MDRMLLLPYAIAAAVAVVGFLCWEPYTARIRARRSVKLADSIRFVDPGACFLFINWTESGERTIGPCYIERIATGWVTFRSFEDGSRMVLTGDQVQKCIRRTFPHPENIDETLYWVTHKEAASIGVLYWPGKEKVQEYLAEKLGITKTIFGEYTGAKPPELSSQK